MPNLLDLLPEDSRKKAIERAERRLQANKARKGLDVSPEIFLIAKAGNYWGWEAIKDIRRGYTLEPVFDQRGNVVTDNGNIKYQRNTLTLEEVNLLVEGADKVRYSQLIEQTHAGVVSGSYKSSSKSFEQALKPFTDKAEVKE